MTNEGVRGVGRLLPALLALVLAAAGCRADIDPAKEAEAPPRPGVKPEDVPVSGGTAVVAVGGEVERPTPVAAETPLDRELAGALYLSLTRPRRDGDRVQHLLSHETPMAAAWLWRYTGPDSVAVRYSMRSGLRWSDGEPLTARDVVWTWRALRRRQAAEAAGIDSVVAENDSVVVFHFALRYPEMLEDAAFPIAPRHQPGAVPLDALVTSGPFRISGGAGGRYTLAPNPNFRPAPRLSAVVLRVVADDSARLAEAAAGGADLAYPVPDGVRGAPNVRLLRARRSGEAAAERNVQTDTPAAARPGEVVAAVGGRLRAVRVDGRGAFANPWEWWIPRDRQGGGSGATNR